jgi:hypothetical protein
VPDRKRMDQHATLGILDSLTGQSTLGLTSGLSAFDV